MIGLLITHLLQQQDQACENLNCENPRCHELRAQAKQAPAQPENRPEPSEAMKAFQATKLPSPQQVVSDLRCLEEASKILSRELNFVRAGSDLPENTHMKAKGDEIVADLGKGIEVLARMSSCLQQSLLFQVFSSV